MIALDEGYQRALVAGPDRSYLWILARRPAISLDDREQLVSFARENGFDVGALIWVDQDRHDPALRAVSS